MEESKPLLDKLLEHVSQEKYVLDVHYENNGDILLCTYSVYIIAYHVETLFISYIPTEYVTLPHSPPTLRRATYIGSCLRTSLQINLGARKSGRMAIRMIVGEKI